MRSAIALVVPLSACPAPEEAAPATPPCPCAGRTLRVATTTSVESSGLLPALRPTFEEGTGIAVQVLAVGTGQALELARRGDVDAVLVHDPASEEAFLAEGAGVNRRALMHNDLVVVGPEADPAGIRGLPAVDAFARMSAARAPFVSRGDESGTHEAEGRLWRRAGATPPWEGYAAAGQGMMPTLMMAAEKGAYCLTDRATHTAAGDEIPLAILVEGDPALLNRYSAIAVNPARTPDAHYREAMEWIGWMTSPEGQAAIGGFQKDGAALFIPDAIP